MKHLHKTNFFNLLLARILINAGDSLYYVATTWTVLQWTHHSVLVGLTNIINDSYMYFFLFYSRCHCFKKDAHHNTYSSIFNFINYNFLYFVGILNVYLLIIFSDTRYVLCANRLSSTVKSNSYFGK